MKAATKKRFLVLYEQQYELCATEYRYGMKICSRRVQQKRDRWVASDEIWYPHHESCEKKYAMQ
jgi:hypothetical protein